MSIQQSINSMLNTTAGAVIGAKALAKKGTPSPSEPSPQPTPQVNPYSINAQKGWKTRRARQIAVQELATLKETQKLNEEDFRKVLGKYQKNLEVK